VVKFNITDTVALYFSL